MSEFHTAMQPTSSCKGQFTTNPLGQSSSMLKMQEHEMSFTSNETLQYINQFMKKETWTQIGNTLNERSTITTLIFSGVNIDGNGLRALSDIIRMNHQVRNLIVEWNYLFNFADEFDYFCNCIATSEIIYLSLNNNKINSSLARSIQNLIRNSKKMMYLDLRWNEIGNDGAKLIMSGLGANSTLIEINLMGNKINNQTLREVSEFIGKTKQGLVSKYNPIDELSDEIMNKDRHKKDGFIENLELGMPLKLIEKEKAITNEFKARYDVQLIQNAKLEKENKDFEKLLDSEQGKINEMKENYEHSINIEKTNRLKAEELSFQLKEKCSRTTLERNQLENELEAKSAQYAKEKENLLLLIKNQKETIDRNASLHDEKIQRLRNEYEKINNNLSSSIAGLSIDNESIKKEYLEQIRNSIEEYEVKVKTSDAQIKQLRQEKEELKNQLSEEKKNALEDKMQLDLVYKKREAQILNDEQSKFAILKQNLEKRIQMLEETNEDMNTKCKTAINDLKQAQESYKNEYVKYESKFNDLSSQNGSLTTKATTYQVENDRICHELKAKENLIAKLNVQVSDLQKYKATLDKNSNAILFKKDKDFGKEREAFEAERNSLHYKISELENSNEQLKAKVNQYTTDLPRLSEKIKKAMMTYIDNY